MAYTQVSLLQWRSILNTPSFLLHTSTTVRNSRCWKYGLWPESAISREQWGMACGAWPGSAIVSAGVWHSCIGLGRNTKHLSGWLRVRGGGGYFRNSSQELKRWDLHVCVDFIQFSTSFSASAAASASATSAASAASAASAQTTVQTVRRQSNWED